MRAVKTIVEDTHTQAQITNQPTSCMQSKNMHISNKQTHDKR